MYVCMYVCTYICVCACVCNRRRRRRLRRGAKQEQMLLRKREREAPLKRRTAPCSRSLRPHSSNLKDRKLVFVIVPEIHLNTAYVTYTLIPHTLHTLRCKEVVDVSGLLQATYIALLLYSFTRYIALLLYSFTRD
jgi:hypothetical protein